MINDTSFIKQHFIKLHTHVSLRQDPQSSRIINQAIA